MVEPWMVIAAAGIAVCLGVFVVSAWRHRSRGPDDTDAPGNTSGFATTKRSQDGPPLSAYDLDPMFLSPAEHEQPEFVPPPRHGPDARQTHRRDAPATADAYAADDAEDYSTPHASHVAAQAARMDSLVQQMKTRADRRVGELDGLIAKARRSVEELQRQSTELSLTLQAARDEAARRQADEIAATRAATSEQAIVAEPIQLVMPPPPPAPPQPAVPERPAAAVEHAAFVRAIANAPAQPANKPNTDDATSTWPIPAQRPLPAGATATPPTAPDGVFVGSRHREVLLLLDQNRPPVEISRALGLEIGEIELIASLNGRRRIRGQA